MRALTEVNEQITKIDLLLHEAYAGNNLDDVILFAQLMSKLVAKKASLEEMASPKPAPIQAWKSVAGINPAYENRILSRDEWEMMDF